MRKPKVHRVSPSPVMFQIGKGRVEPEALKRSPSTTNSKRFDENTIVWGENDSFPLELMKAVDESPVTTACIDLRSDFIKGAGFTDPLLEKIPINKKGETLYELHCQLADILALLDGFAVLHKYNRELKITSAYYIGFEGLRFVKPNDDTDDEMVYVKHNPFWGTQEFNRKFTETYPLFNLELLPDQIRKMGKDFKGQVYYYGTVSPLYRFYPRPKYWSAEKWIKADGKLQDFHNENLENGFFQSSLINVIGNPSEMSSNPKYQREVTSPTDGQKRLESTKTVGEEFNEMMSESFSGARKAGTAMVLWSNSKETSAQISAFPTNTNSDLMQGTFASIIRGITIGTKTPAILANLPQSENSLGSDGASFQKAVEMMQQRTQAQRKQLEHYYNNVLLPNLSVPPTAKVEIKPYQPASVEVEINDKVWEFMNDTEKQIFVKKNFNIELVRTAVPVQGQEPTSEALKNLKLMDIQRIQGIVRRFNKEQITYDQAKQLMKSYGFSDSEIDVWLVTPEEDVT